LLQVFARRTVAYSFKDHVADGEPFADEWLEPNAACRQVAPVLGRRRCDVVLLG